MKKLPALISLLLLCSSAVFAQMGVNANGSQPDASAGMDVSFSDKGFLPPRVALTATNAATPVAAPALGLLVYNTAVAGAPPNNVMAGYYYWDGAKWVAVSVNPGASVGDMRYWDGTQWVIVPAGTNGQFLSFRYGRPVWADAAFACGTSVTVNHVAGAVAPVTKSVTYGTVTGIPGELSKCWTTRNLGASRQATAVNDGSEASAGWYWQFNRKQGYKHDGSNRTPNTTWNNYIYENIGWSATNDPCTIELGTTWRIPSRSEWSNINAAGSWVNWNGPWNSALKLHAAGEIYYNTGVLIDRGVYGYNWSNTNSEGSLGYTFFFGNPLDFCDVTEDRKPSGMPLRCIRDY
jgi:hypothetical protein